MNVMETKMRRSYLHILGMFLVGWLFFPASVHAGKIKTEVVSLDTRAGVTQKFVLFVPDKPLASLVLFSGGFGFIDLQAKEDRPKIKRDKSFLVKYRREFAEQRLVVAIVEAPSDHLHKGSSGHKKAPGMGLDWRLSDEHMQDVSTVINCLKEATMAKYFATEAACRASDEATRILGAYAYSLEYPVQRYYRDVRFLLYGGGTHEVLKTNIARWVGL